MRRGPRCRFDGGSRSRGRRRFVGTVRRGSGRPGYTGGRPSCWTTSAPPAASCSIFVESRAPAGADDCRRTVAGPAPATFVRPCGGVRRRRPTVCEGSGRADDCGPFPQAPPRFRDSFAVEAVVTTVDSRDAVAVEGVAEATSGVVGWAASVAGVVGVVVGAAGAALTTGGAPGGASKRHRRTPAVWFHIPTAQRKKATSSSSG